MIQATSRLHRRPDGHRGEGVRQSDGRRPHRRGTSPGNRLKRVDDHRRGGHWRKREGRPIASSLRRGMRRKHLFNSFSSGQFLQNQLDGKRVPAITGLPIITPGLEQPSLGNRAHVPFKPAYARRVRSHPARCAGASLDGRAFTSAQAVRRTVFAVSDNSSRSWRPIATAAR